jgi:DNA-binding LacI/PurR family transcriptional regulator
MADVARLAGVSPKTVSRVVNHAPNVRDAVRERVNDAIAELGFRPNAAARALASQRTRVIGIVCQGSSLYGPSEQLFGLERAARQAGYSVEIVTAGDDVGDIESAVERLLDHGVDGIVLAVPLGTTDLDQAVFREVPCVAVDDPGPGRPRVRTVIGDQGAGARQAVEHLLALGHRTVHHVSGPLPWTSAQAREAAWREVLQEAGAIVPSALRGDWSPRSGYAAGLALAEDPAVTAVFVANDHMATGLLRAMWEHGRRVPDDVSVVGFDDTPEAEFMIVPLTTVRQAFADVSSRAVTELVATMSGRAATEPENILIPVELVVRASSGPAPVPTTASTHAPRPAATSRRAPLDHQQQGDR